jgi:hypothetical protein
MDEAPIKPIEKKNDATKRMRVRFTIMASFISGECRHLRETHGNIKAVPPGSRMPPVSAPSIRYGGQSGHRLDLSSCLLMTQAV